MSAVDTAGRVLGWATAPHGPPPRGDLRDADALVRAPAELHERLAELATITAAKLRFGAASRFAREARTPCLLLAAALGVVSDPGTMRALLAALPKPKPEEWVIRHALVGPALPYFAPATRTADRTALDVAVDLLGASPLSLVWFRPAPGDEATAIPVVERVAADAGARRAAIVHLSEPSERPDIRAFRADLLDRLRVKTSASCGFVVDVYEAMMVHHRDRALDQIRRARDTLVERAASASDDHLQDALSVAALWEPLAAIESSMAHVLRERRYLGYDYREGLALARLAQPLKGPA